ncbi:hypothetical protein Pmar_PMAR017056 [Perkinsus marinus ATCC 50983]|uniref:Uncharacterized protein n=1 Tax=Perkinsus marinus (strain ATCC 50983 / TXsc) TaxID=423536 RepID=C5LSF7_PERM5|nr:hypothetical protein Pmar_PMAR017056 [Perkinsus marinus ATCC 50983]EER00198.1 hypothetical protein Pmar_PMAR017056 [Perkinsus marinus ATCC 50983]|eukprot:XP_002767480.1 hypothetical protein Pmar_PMAR017056 [Perkinsus marinus ATCC 50983]
MLNPQSPPSDSTQHHQYEEATVGTWDHTETQPEGILKDDGDDGITSRGDLNMSPAAPLVPLAATKQSHRTQ